MKLDLFRRGVGQKAAWHFIPSDYYGLDCTLDYRLDSREKRTCFWYNCFGIPIYMTRP